MSEDIRKLFIEKGNQFTVYLVSNNFANYAGLDFFHSYRGTKHYINTNFSIREKIFDILKSIGKNIPNITELIKTCFEITSLNTIDMISNFSKLCGTLLHQAAEKNDISPIIIQEGNILPKYLNQLFSLYNESNLNPIIIVILKDNDFTRGKQLFSKAPHNMCLKIIHSVEKTETYKIINCGANDPDEFLDAFSNHCLSTCSKTKTGILYNKEWSGDSMIKVFGPEILRIRSMMLFSDKTLLKNDLNLIIKNINNTIASSERNKKLLLSFECMLKLFRVFCNDGGTQDIQDALLLAKELNNEILLAHVYKNSNFLNQFSFDDKIKLMDNAYNIFYKYGILDHAFGSKNNMLVKQFEAKNLPINEFVELEKEATSSIPGLVGMSHIHNNVGASLLTNGYPEESLDYFSKALTYASRPERCVQYAAIRSNMLIAQICCHDEIKEKDILRTLDFIFNNSELLNLPFLSARYALNIISIALHADISWGIELLNQYRIKELIQSSFNTNPLGSGQLLLQMKILEQRYNEFNLLDQFILPSILLEAKGIRADFIEKTGLNPCSFSMWF